MTIDLDFRYATGARGNLSAVDVEATISFSPREGWDADKIAELEHDLGPYISERLNAAIKRGGAA